MAFGRILGQGIFFQSGQYWTSSYYLGLGTLWLALLAVWKNRNRRVCLLAVLSIIAILFAFGAYTPVLPAIRKFLPELGFVTYPVKYLLLVTFIAPLLAAFSLARLQELRPQKQIFTIGIILFALLGMVLIWQWHYPLPYDEVHPALLNGLSRAVFLAVTGAVILVFARESRHDFWRITSVVLILVIWLDVLTHEPAQNPTVTSNIYDLGLAREKLAMNPQPEIGGSRAMVTPKAYRDFIGMALLDSKNNYLVKRLGFCGDCNLLDGAPKVDGFFSLSTRENDGLFSLLYSTTNDFPHLDDFLGVSQITAPDEIYNWRSRKTFLPLVTAGQKPFFLDDATTLRALSDSSFDGSKVVFLQPEAKSFITATNQTEANVLDSKFEDERVSIDVQAAAPALVVIAQTFYHNWRATVDGRDVPLLRANYGFQAIEVPQGRHDVRLVYKDRAFEVGAVVSMVSLFACLLSCFYFRKH
jgi:hypothetical protein